MSKKPTTFSMENWTTQLRKGLIEVCILNVLHKNEMYGYDIVKRLAEIPGLVITEGTIYPLLSRLKKSGIVETRLVESPSGPARKYYFLTKNGKATRRLMNACWNNLSTGVEGLMS